MPWICPGCGCEFHKTAQAHSCLTVDANSHLSGKPAWMREAFQRLEGRVVALGDVRTAATRSGITYLAPTTFLAVKTTAKALEIEFVAAAPIHEPLVYKVFQMSTSRWANYVRVEEPGEPDERLMGWIEGAYKLIRGGP